MAAMERPRRATAGKNISKLIDQEEIRDEFYSTAYGGFEEASEDEEYQSEDEIEDVVDSDFDLSEREESEDGEEALQKGTPKPKKKKWTKYIVKKTSSTPKVLGTPAPSKRKKKESHTPSIQPVTPSEPRSLRQSTIDLSLESSRVEEIRRQEKDINRRFSGPPKRKAPRLTQEQLLAEAKRTEIENLASLEAYTRLEAQRKTYKVKQHSIAGPAVRFHSLTMPCLTNEAATSNQNSIDNNTNKDNSNKVAKYSRNFIVFTDSSSIPSSFFSSGSVAPPKPKQLYCKVTGLPARYIDPLTKFPYSSAQAFRVIRDRFVKEREEKCDERLQQLSDWLEEKKRLKKQSN